MRSAGDWKIFDTDKQVVFNRNNEKDQEIENKEEDEEEKEDNEKERANWCCSLVVTRIVTDGRIAVARAVSGRDKRRQRVLGSRVRVKGERLSERGNKGVRSL